MAGSSGGVFYEHQSRYHVILWLSHCFFVWLHYENTEWFSVPLITKKLLWGFKKEIKRNKYIQKYQFPRRPLTESEIDTCLKSRVSWFQKRPVTFSLLLVEDHLSAEPRLSSCLTLPPVAASTEPIYWTHDELRTYNTLKMTLIYFNALSGKYDYFYWFRRTLSQQVK